MAPVATTGMGRGVGAVPNGWVYTGGNGMVGERGYNLSLRTDEDESCHCEEAFRHRGK